MPGWESFFVAEIGAAAALAGLIFVGVSINLIRVLSVEGLEEPALEALLLLLAVLVISTLALVPGQPTWLVGAEVLVAGFVFWLTILIVQLRNLRKVDAEWRPRFVRSIFFSQVATVPYILSGVAILLRGAHGVYWMVPGIIASFVTAVVTAWVLLIEINR